jgi:hypothetical protein
VGSGTAFFIEKMERVITFPCHKYASLSSLRDLKGDIASRKPNEWNEEGCANFGSSH